MKAMELTGQRYGRLTVISLDTTRVARRNGKMWLCRCDCGARASVSGERLRNGRTRSCGCLRVEMRGTQTLTHGMSKSPTWNCWQRMRRRCYDPNSIQYPYYGGRGITVCERWEKFENFLEDMGEVPPGMSIDRIDNDKGYEPGNVRWATKTEQARNKRSNVRLLVGGQEMLASDFVKTYGLVKGSVYHMIKKGKTAEEILRFYGIEVSS